MGKSRRGAGEPRMDSGSGAGWVDELPTIALGGARHRIDCHPADDPGAAGIPDRRGRRDWFARRVADATGIARAFGSYQELLDAAAVDAVYIPLPNHLHVPWSVRALEAGKHVLCEKPIGLNPAEAETLIAVAART